MTDMEIIVGIVAGLVLGLCCSLLCLYCFVGCHSEKEAEEMIPPKLMIIANTAGIKAAPAVAPAGAVTNNYYNGAGPNAIVGNPHWGGGQQQQQQQQQQQVQTYPWPYAHNVQHNPMQRPGAATVQLSNRVFSKAKNSKWGDIRKNLPDFLQLSKDGAFSGDIDDGKMSLIPGETGNDVAEEEEGEEREREGVSMSKVKHSKMKMDVGHLNPNSMLSKLRRVAKLTSLSSRLVSGVVDRELMAKLYDRVASAEAAATHANNRGKQTTVAKVLLIEQLAKDDGELLWAILRLPPWPKPLPDVVKTYLALPQDDEELEVLEDELNQRGKAAKQRPDGDFIERIARAKTAAKGLCMYLRQGYPRGRTERALLKARLREDTCNALVTSFAKKANIGKGNFSSALGRTARSSTDVDMSRMRVLHVEGSEDSDVVKVLFRFVDTSAEVVADDSLHKEEDLHKVSTHDLELEFLRLLEDGGSVLHQGAQLHATIDGPTKVLSTAMLDRPHNLLMIVKHRRDTHADDGCTKANKQDLGKLAAAAYERLMARPAPSLDGEDKEHIHENADLDFGFKNLKPRGYVANDQAARVRLTMPEFSATVQTLQNELKEETMRMKADADTAFAEAGKHSKPLGQGDEEDEEREQDGENKEAVQHSRAPGAEAATEGEEAEEAKEATYGPPALSELRKAAKYNSLASKLENGESDQELLRQVFDGCKSKKGKQSECKQEEEDSELELARADEHKITQELMSKLKADGTLYRVLGLPNNDPIVMNFTSVQNFWKSADLEIEDQETEGEVLEWAWKELKERVGELRQDLSEEINEERDQADVAYESAKKSSVARPKKSVSQFKHHEAV
jgi:hypothetical protein